MCHTLPPIRKRVLMHSGQYTIHVHTCITRACARVSQLHNHNLKVGYTKYSDLLLAYTTTGSKQVQVTYLHFLII